MNRNLLDHLLPLVTELRAHWTVSDQRLVTAVLDAILPQVTTVEELDSLPEGSIVLNPGTGDVWTRGVGTRDWFGAGCIMPDLPEALIEWAAPLTVVYRPDGAA